MKEFVVVNYTTILYLFGMLVAWTGGVVQLIKMYCTKSTRSISLWWLACGNISLLVRLPKAVSTDKVFGSCYLIGYGLSVTVLLSCFILRLKYPKR